MFIHRSLIFNPEMKIFFAHADDKGSPVSPGWVRSDLFRARGCRDRQKRAFPDDEDDV